MKQTRSSYLASDSSTALICSVSKEYDQGGHLKYWYAFHPYQKEFLEKTENSYIAFGCGSEDTTVLIPSKEFLPWLEGFNITEKPDRYYWHIHITYRGEKLLLNRKQGADPIEITEHILPK